MVLRANLWRVEDVKFEKHPVPLLALAAALVGSACVESREAPALIPQAQVAYGDRLYLLDETRDAEPTLGRCTRFGEDLVGVRTSTEATPVSAVDGKGDPIDPSIPHNCFVPVQAGSLTVDVVESTNDLFQLCVDSGACNNPDPAESNKTQVCSDEEAFDRCPLVEASQQQAVAFCSWIGRRLPSSFEHLIIRQAAFDQADLRTFTAFPSGSEAPASCDDAVTRAPGCVAAKPRPISLGSSVRGAAARDLVRVEGGKEVYDLMGNASEWTSDLFPTRRGTAEGLPWFCLAKLSEPAGGFTSADPPTCPTGSRCVWGQYQPSPTMLLGLYPVCVTSSSGRFSGTVGALFGGSHRDERATRERIGTFARRTETDPQGLPDTARAREYGIRCVGNRSSAVDGVVPSFGDEVVLRDRP
jgi:hypothetical protein